MVKYDNIPGFPGYYISKRGGLWSNRKNGQWKKLKPHLNKMWNRYQCTLRDSRGIRKLCKISRLVATVYLPNPENLPIVMHLDNNPANDLSVYAECSCGNSFYIETEDEQDNYSEW